MSLKVTESWPPPEPTLTKLLLFLCFVDGTGVAQGDAPVLFETGYNSTYFNRAELYMSNRTSYSAELMTDERGSTVVQLLVVVVIVSILSTFAVIRIRSARQSIALQNSMHLFAGRIEKARLDAIRRHASALVEFTSNNTYAIHMDFEGTAPATLPVRTFTLENNVVITNPDGTTIATEDLPTIDFGWRGGTAQCFTSIRMQNGLGESTSLAVTSSGDVTIDTNLGATVSPGTYSSVNQTSDISSGATVTGTSPASCDDPCGSCGSSGGSGSSSPPPACSTFTVNPLSVTVKRNSGSTATVTVGTTTLADRISLIQPDGRTNLRFTPTSQSLGANSSGSFVITSIDRSTGKFSIKFVSACNSSNSVSGTVTVTK
jgi:Tfp pilus assembly protein FimT